MNDGVSAYLTAIDVFTKLTWQPLTNPIESCKPFHQYSMKLSARLMKNLDSFAVSYDYSSAAKSTSFSPRCHIVYFSVNIWNNSTVSIEYHSFKRGVCTPSVTHRLRPSPLFPINLSSTGNQLRHIYYINATSWLI